MGNRPYITLAVFERENHKLCDLYDSRSHPEGQAQDVSITSELHGWKE